MTETTSLNAGDLFVVAKDMGGRTYANRKVQFNNVSASGIVLQTTDQIINGTKTFTSFPVSASGYPTENFQFANKQYVDNNTPTGVVFVTSDQVIAGTKTFSSFPVSPSGYPTTDFQMANKKYVDTNAGLVAWEVITGNTQAVSGRGYFINAVSNTIGLTLPATPTVGQTVNARAIDSTYTITILRNGSNIESNAEDIVINVGSAGMILTYADSTRGWVITPNVADIGIGTTNLIYANTQATVGSLYLIDATSNTVALTLPATPIIGWKVRIRVLNSTYAVTIARNGSNIESVEQDMTVNVSNAGFELVYADVARGWVVAQNVANIKQAGEWVLKERKEFASAATSYTFTGLDGDSKRRYKIIVFMLNGTGSYVFMTMNTDTGTNYIKQNLRVSNTSINGYVNDNLSGMSIGYVSNSATLGTVSESILYAKSGSYRTCSSNVYCQASAATDLMSDRLNFVWRNSVLNITQLVFTADTSLGIGAGSYIELWELAQ